VRGGGVWRGRGAAGAGAARGGAGMTDRLANSSEPRASFPIGAAWYVARTAPHRETSAGKRIEEAGYGCYLPMQTRTIRHARRVLEVKRPLFARHLFVQIDPSRQGFYPVRLCRGVEEILGATGIPCRVSDAVVEELRA